MKKSLLLFLLLPLTAAAGFAQESRQDVSVSGTALIPPFIAGNAVQLHATTGFGFLGSYRYLLTPHSGLEVNYQYAQEVQHYINPTNNILIHDRFQEISGAYVHNFVFRNFNPFLEGGPAGIIFDPIRMTQDTDAECQPEHQCRRHVRGRNRLRAQPQLRHSRRVSRNCGEGSQLQPEQSEYRPLLQHQRSGDRRCLPLLIDSSSAKKASVRKRAEAFSRAADRRCRLLEARKGKGPGQCLALSHSAVMFEPI